MLTGELLNGQMLTGKTLHPDKCSPFNDKVSDPTEPCEAWNNSFRQLVGHHHPGVWTTIECLRMDQALAATKLTQAERGEPPRKKQKRGIQQSQIRLRTLCQEFAAGTRPLELFLEAVARNIRLM
ncbi:hypothetical protein ACOMHN_007882 [Nucella lapillus]